MQESADTGARLADALISVFNLAMFARDVMKLPDGAKQAAVILTKGNSMLLMLGFQNPEQTLGLEVAGEAVGTMRSEIEAMVDAGLGSPPSVMSVAADVANLTNSLLAYANTVRYSRMRNGNTLALEYLRRLYRSGGDQTEFARSLGLAPTASVQDCIRAVNKSAFGFPTLEIDANSYDPSLVEKLVDHWTGAISEYAALKAQ